MRSSSHCRVWNTKKLRVRPRESAITCLRDLPTVLCLNRFLTWLISKPSPYHVFQMWQLKSFTEKNNISSSSVSFLAMDHLMVDLKSNLRWFSFWIFIHSSRCQVDNSPSLVIKVNPILAQGFLLCQHLFMRFCLSCWFTERLANEASVLSCF